MNYRHLYHAGNFADVMKHAVLVEVVKSLQQKEAGFCYIDTHAGIGKYDLLSDKAQKTKEYEAGIGIVLKGKKISKEFEDYVNIVREFDVAKKEAVDPSSWWNSEILQYYPGSPRIVGALLRSQDSMILNELHSQDYESLKKEFRRDKQVTIHHRDAYEFLPAVLPPKEKRGVVLIDPPYEKLSEYDGVIEAVYKSLQRFTNGVYMIWLPVKDRTYQDFYQNLRNKINQEMLVVDLVVKKFPAKVSPLSFFTKDSEVRKKVARETNSMGLVGSAIVLINPPWKIEMALQHSIKKLWKLWSGGEIGFYNVKSIEERLATSRRVIRW